MSSRCKNCGAYADGGYVCSPRCAGIVEGDDGCVICHSWDGYSWLRRRCAKHMREEDEAQLARYREAGDTRMVAHMEKGLAKNDFGVDPVYERTGRSVLSREEGQ